MRSYGSLWRFDSAFVYLSLLCLCACSGEQHDEDTKTGLVREGMSHEDVRTVLGSPKTIDSSGVIYNVDAGTRQKVERWYYEKRTVVLINDTVKSTNER